VVVVMAAPQLLALTGTRESSGVVFPQHVGPSPNAMQSQLVNDFRSCHISFDVRTR
jgi:hypothetical protein